MAPPRTGNGHQTRVRLLDAALQLAAAQGVAGTNMAEVARAAGCSRATAYRLFASKPSLFEAAAQREVVRFTAQLAVRMDAADTFEDALTLAVVKASGAFGRHAALQSVLAHEPGVVLEFLGFGRVDEFYATVRAVAAPLFTRFVGPDRAGWAAEWVSRLVLSHLFIPRTGVDLADPDQARSVIGQFLLPAFASDPTRPLDPVPSPVLT